MDPGYVEKLEIHVLYFVTYVKHIGQITNKTMKLITIYSVYFISCQTH